MQIFSVVNTIAPHDPRLIESLDAEPWIWKADYECSTQIFDCAPICGPNPHIVQGSTVAIYKRKVQE